LLKLPPPSQPRPERKLAFCANKLGKKLFKSDWMSYDHS
jgi:hypothetical protein